MKTVIDNMTALTGWSVSGTGLIEVANWTHLAADYLGSQMFVTLSANEVLSKTFSPAKSTGYGHLSFSIVMKPFPLSQLPTGYWLTFKVFSGVNSKEYYVPNITQFDFVSFDCPYTTIDKIEFTAQTGLTFFISNIINYEDQLPYDLYQAVKAQIEQNITAGDKVSVGSLTGSAGATTATIANPASYVDKYSKISFGGESKELRSINHVAGGPVSITLDSALAGSHTSAAVSLEIPVVVEANEKIALVPGIAITDSFAPQEASEFEQYSTINDSYTTDGFVRSRRTGTTWEFTVNIRASARQAKILEICGKILRKSFPQTSQIWINGRRHESRLDSFEFIDYDGATDILPQINCIIKVYITEESWQEETQTQSIDWTTTVTMG